MFFVSEKREQIHGFHVIKCTSAIALHWGGRIVCNFSIFYPYSVWVVQTLFFLTHTVYGLVWVDFKPCSYHTTPTSRLVTCQLMTCWWLGTLGQKTEHDLRLVACYRKTCWWLVTLGYKTRDSWLALLHRTWGSFLKSYALLAVKVVFLVILRPFSAVRAMIALIIKAMIKDNKKILNLMLVIS